MPLHHFTKRRYCLHKTSGLREQEGLPLVAKVAGCFSGVYLRRALGSLDPDRQKNNLLGCWLLTVL